MFCLGLHTHNDKLVVINVFDNLFDYNFAPLKAIAKERPFQPNEEGRRVAHLTFYLSNNHTKGRPRPWKVQVPFEKGRAYATAEGAVNAVIKRIQELEL